MHIFVYFKTQKAQIDLLNDACLIFNIDLSPAAIEKEDEMGRTLDVHTLWHTFGTHLSKAGAAPRVSQVAMRHLIDISYNKYL